MESKEYIQTVQPRRIFQVMVITALIFGVFSFIGQLVRLYPDYYYPNHTPIKDFLWFFFTFQFGVNTEGNIATHFNTLILVIVSALFLLIALLKNVVKDKHRISWFILSLFVLYLSIDEQAVLHEKLNKVFSGWTSLNGWFEYKWVIPGIIGVAVFAVLFIPFFLHLDFKFKALFIISAGMYFSGALGSEMFSGHYASIYGTKNITYSLMTTIEEMLEFNGVNLLIYSLLHYLEINFSSFHVAIQSGGMKSISQNEKLE